MRLNLIKIKSNKGFTLIEMLITLALMAVVSVPIGAALIFGLKVYDTEVAVDRSFQNQQDVFLSIKNQIRANPSQVEIISLEGGESALEIGKDTSKIRYYQNGQKLYKLEGIESKEVLSDIKGFNLLNTRRNSSNKLLSFTLELVSTSNGRDQSLKADFALDRY